MAQKIRETAGTYFFKTIASEIPFSRSGLKDSSSAHMSATAETGMLQDPGGDRSHRLADSHSETLQSSIILPVQVADLEFDFLLGNIWWLMLVELQTSR